MGILQKFLERSGMGQIAEASNRGKKEKYLVKVVKEVCADYENGEELTAFIFRNTATKRILNELIDGAYGKMVYKDFMVLFAMHLAYREMDPMMAFPLVKGILTLWFSAYDTDEEMEQPDECLIADIISEQSRLYEAYFNLYQDSEGQEGIRVLCPNSKEVIVRMNIEDGVPAGFILMGFDYYLLKDGEYAIHLKRAVTDQRREWLDFNGDFESHKDKQEIWVY